MADAPLVSIVIPVYNGSNYLAQAINSALAQTYSNIEVIVVNDGSQDGGKTEAVALSYGARIRYFAKANGKVSSALNHGIRHMRGSYFSWLSHDDIYYPNKIAEQIQLVQAQGLENAILYSDYDGIDSASQFIANSTQDHDRLIKKPLYGILQIAIHGCSVLVPRACLDQVGLFDETLYAVQDYDMWFRLAQRFRFVHMPHTLIAVRSHGGQDSTTRRALHLKECNALWIRMLSSLTAEQISDCAATPYVFFSDMASFLKQMGFLEAHAYVQSRLRSQRAATTISVVLCVDDRLDLAREALASVLCQSHANLEVVLVNAGPTANAGPLQAWCGLDPRVRLAPPAGAAADAAWQHGLAQARGGYVAFLGAADLFAPTKIERHLHFLQANTLAGSHTAHLKVPAPGRHAGHAHAPPRGAVLSTCMVRTAPLRARSGDSPPTLTPLLPDTTALSEPLTVLRSGQEFYKPKRRLRALGAALTQHTRAAGAAAGDLELPRLYAAIAAVHGLPPGADTALPTLARRAQELLRQARGIGRLRKWRRLAARLLDRSAARLGALARRWNAG